MITCWSCGRDNEAFFKFCLNCGAELDRPEPVAAAEAPKGAPRAAREGAPSPQAPIPAAAETRGPEPAPAVTGPCLVIIRADQSEGERLPLQAGLNRIGRTEGELTFGDDACLAPHHLDLEVDGSALRLVPRATRNGVFVRLQTAAPIEQGAQFRVGQQLLRIDWIERLVAVIPPGENGETTLGSPVPDAAWGRLSVLRDESHVCAAYVLAADEVRLGREEGAVRFGHDPFVSGAHARLVRGDDGHVELVDEGSRNGTYLRVTEPRALTHGDTILAGQQLLRVHLPS